jgi:hypothetical protein
MTTAGQEEITIYVGLADANKKELTHPSYKRAEAKLVGDTIPSIEFPPQREEWPDIAFMFVYADYEGGEQLSEAQFLPSSVEAFRTRSNLQIALENVKVKGEHIRKWLSVHAETKSREVELKAKAEEVFKVLG